MHHNNADSHTPNGHHPRRLGRDGDGLANALPKSQIRLFKDRTDPPPQTLERTRGSRARGP